MSKGKISLVILFVLLLAGTACNSNAHLWKTPPTDNTQQAIAVKDIQKKSLFTTETKPSPSVTLPSTDNEALIPSAPKAEPCTVASSNLDSLAPLKLDNMLLYQNILYNANPIAAPVRNSLDIYTPGASQPQDMQSLPVLLYVHGGGWQTGDKSNKMDAKPAFFTSQGMIFISINYRMVPEVSFPVFAQDVACAVAWVYQNISSLGGDPDQLALMGHSAGAHLVSLISTDESYLNTCNLDLSILDGTISLDTGAFDIPALMAEAGPRLRKTYRTAFGTDPAIWQKASPMFYVTPGKDIPPFLLIYAGERKASENGAIRMANAIHKIGMPAKLFHAVDKNHATLNEDIGKPNDKATGMIISFLKRIWNE